MRVLWAYLSEVSADRVAQLISRTLPQLKVTDTFEVGERSIMCFLGDRCRATIEISSRSVFPIEVDVTLDDGLLESQLGHDQIAFGEWLVDNLGCTAVVDCGGRYVPALSDYLTRITSNKIESIEIPDDSVNIDESKTLLVKSRP
jgi:hypothetical protein